MLLGGRGWCVSMVAGLHCSENAGPIRGYNTDARAAASVMLQ